ncbi:MAG TPA: hypothetical protein PLK77_18655 [Pyrinomonadaceae bacterium]|nr:hypothetical protein [Pyrinomonadaceae bacterium]
MSSPELVHTITDWYDGAREGVADFRGAPHYFLNEWDEDKGFWTETYFLAPLDDETFNLSLENWEIWLRWDRAFKRGQTTQETHPALPEDRRRHEELEAILKERLVVDTNAGLRATAKFEYGEPTRVVWTE